MRPNNGVEYFIGVLLRNKILPKSDWERLVKGEKFTGEGLGLELDIENDKIIVKRNKTVLKPKEHHPHKDSPFYDIGNPVVEEHNSGMKIYKPNQEITKANKEKHEKEKTRKEKLKAHDWKKESDIIQLLAQEMGVME
jgi:hypothetical protein